MRQFRSITAAFFASFLIGCSNQTIRSRQFEISLVPDNSTRSVVLIEHVEQSGGGDGPQFDPEKILDANWAESNTAGHFDIVKPETYSDVWWLGLRRREQLARWTIFRPGFVVTTIYPEGRDIWDSGVAVPTNLNARLGWCTPKIDDSRYNEMRPNEILGAAYGKNEPDVKLIVPLRLIPQSAKPLEPNPRWQIGPFVPPRDGLCAADAATFQWQIHELLTLIQQGKLKSLSPSCRQTIFSALADEAEKLHAGGLNADLKSELDHGLMKLNQVLP